MSVKKTQNNHSKTTWYRPVVPKVCFHSSITWKSLEMQILKPFSRPAKLETLCKLKLNIQENGLDLSRHSN